MVDRSRIPDDHVKMQVEPYLDLGILIIETVLSEGIMLMISSCWPCLRVREVVLVHAGPINMSDFKQQAYCIVDGRTYGYGVGIGCNSCELILWSHQFSYAS